MAFRKSRPKSDHACDNSERNQLRSHAIFVRFLERRGLGHCARYFPEDVTWNQLKTISVADLHRKYGIQDPSDLENFSRVLSEIRREDSSEVEDEVSSVLVCFMYCKVNSKMRII